MPKAACRGFHGPTYRNGFMRSMPATVTLDAVNEYTTVRSASWMGLTCRKTSPASIEYDGRQI